METVDDDLDFNVNYSYFTPDEEEKLNRHTTDAETSADRFTTTTTALLDELVTSLSPQLRSDDVTCMTSFPEPVVYYCVRRDCTTGSTVLLAADNNLMSLPVSSVLDESETAAMLEDGDDGDILSGLDRAIEDKCRLDLVGLTDGWVERLGLNTALAGAEISADVSGEAKDWLYWLTEI